ncbi:MAG: sensor histidine kinase [Chloroflexi bacterium]|nr:sensor histidine kinase [Chloroflexota bacterium]
MREIALHLLDIAENGVAAESRNIHIDVIEDIKNDLLKVSVKDDGRGMDAETAKRALDPFYTTRTTRKVGLGIPLLKLAAESAGGGFTLETESGKGARIEASFRHSHIDRMPLGDVGATFLTLLVSYPHIHWVFKYQVTSKDGPTNSFELDDEEVKAALGDTPLTEPDVLKILRGMIEEGIQALAPQTEY